MELARKQSRQSRGWDNWGKVASGICALHCAFCAFLPSLFTFIGLDILLEHEAEWAFTIVAIVFAIGAMITGGIKHGSSFIVGLFALGVAGLGASRFIEEAGGHELGIVIGLASGILLVVTHLKNTNATSACELSCCDSQG